MWPEFWSNNKLLNLVNLHLLIGVFLGGEFSYFENLKNMISTHTSDPNLPDFELFFLIQDF
jgi:hypothetical protein